MNKLLRVGVFLGGPSSEKEVSLEGGRYVYQRLDRERFEPVPVFVDHSCACWRIPERLIIQNTTKDLTALLESSAERLTYEQLPTMIDFAFVIGHGKYLEDGCFQGLFEIIGLPYNGPGILGAALGADKWVSRKILRGAGINTPKTVPVLDDNWHKDRDNILKSFENVLDYPVVTKPAREGCSTAITVAKDRAEATAGIDAALVWDRLALVEELIPGTEVTVSVVGNEEKESLPVSETPRHRRDDYLTLEDKFLPGGAEMITPARLSPAVTKEVQDIARRAADELRLVGYPRFDMFVNGETIVVLEANTLPGITPSTMIFHQAAEVGINPTGYLTRIIELGLEAHREKRGPL